jgi:sigma-54 dependent transcriptional regulator, acetoin dehydrogenase operon transcriptional activator AcoR
MLLLDEPDQLLWDRFRAGQVTLNEIQTNPLLQRWWRAATAGVRVEGSAPALGVGGADLVERRARFDESIAGALAHVEPMVAELSRRGLLLVLADAQGCIVHARGGGTFADRATASALAEGACWSEDCRGTNGIGTALTEASPVGVIGRAHYDRGAHGLFCYGAPLRDARGKIVGALDVSGAVENRTPAVKLAVLATAGAIEREARAHAYSRATPGGYGLVARMLEKCSIGALLVEAPGVVRLHNEAAARVLGLPRAGATLPLQRALGIDWEELQEKAFAGRGVEVLSAAQGRVRVEVQPLLDPRGEAFAAVVYVETVATLLAAPRREVPVRRPPRVPFEAILGSDPDLRATLRTCERFAATDVPVLIVSETGTGKDLVARGIHLASARAEMPFVAVNCGALSASLLESELFGYAAGAFTGARAGGHAGKLGAAQGGTLFLDEIGEMPEALQAMLLRVLEDGSYYRVGDNQVRHADIRVVCATSRDLPAYVQQGRFREDLLYRIQGVRATLPPLRRRTDKLEVARGLLAREAKQKEVPAPRLSPEAERFIEQHTWPGNVRELKSALRHAMVLADGSPVLGLEHFPRHDTEPAFDDAPPSSRVPVSELRPLVVDGASLRDLEVGAVERALAAAGGNVSEAARRLGVARSTLYRMLRKREGER